MCFWETHIFACLSSFYSNNVARHLWSNLQTCKLFFGGKKSLNVSNVKLLSKIFSTFLASICLFGENDSLHYTYQVISPGIKNLNSLNDLNSLNNLSVLNDLNSLISSKNLYFKVKMYMFDGLLNFMTWKRPLKVKILRKKMNLWFFPNWTIDGAQHWFNKNYLGRQKCGFLRNT
jgi:hypothetical protein